MPNNPYLESLANFNATLQAGKDLFSQFALAIQQKAQSFIPAPIDYPQPIEYLGASLSNTTPFSDLFSGKTKGEAETIRTEMEEWFADRFDWFDQIKPSEKRYPTTDSFAAAFKTWSEELKKWESLRSRLYTIAGTFIKSLPPYKTPEGAEILGHNVSEISKIHSIFKADKPNWLAKSFQELDDSKKQADLDYAQWELNVKKPDSVYFSDPAQKKQAEQDFSKVKKDSKKLLTKIKKEIDDVIVAKTPVLTYPPIEFIGVTSANFNSFEANLINLSIADLQNKNNDAFGEWTDWQIQAPKKPNKNDYPNDAEWQKADDEYTQKFQEAEKLYKDIEKAIDDMIAKKQIVFPALEYFGYGPSDMNALTKGLVDELDPVTGSLDISDVQDYKNDLPSFINGKIAEIQKLSSDPNFTTPEIDKWLKFQPKIEKALDDAISTHQKKYPPSSSSPVSSGFAYTAQDGNVYTLSDLPAFKNYLAGLKTQKACKNEAAQLSLYAQPELAKLQQGTKEYNDFESTYNMFQSAILSEIAAKKQANSAKKAGKNANTNPPQSQPTPAPTSTSYQFNPIGYQGGKYILVFKNFHKSDINDYKKYLKTLPSENDVLTEKLDLDIFLKGSLQEWETYNQGVLSQSDFNKYRARLISQINSFRDEFEDAIDKEIDRRQKSAPPAPRTIPPYDGTGKNQVAEFSPDVYFPKDVSETSETNVRLGGSTGAKMVEDSNGNRFIMKKGNSPDHLKSECYADAFYQAAGVKVPAFKLYDDNGTPIKLSAELKDAKSLDDWWSSASKKERSVMQKKLRQGYAADILLGNWDVVGMGADNILVDKNGEPWRIDNGGSLKYRAQGAVKTDEQWGKYIDDLFTMTGNGNIIGINTSSTIPQYYGSVRFLDMAKEINERDWTKALATLPPDERKVIENRLWEIRQLAERGADAEHFGRTQESTDEMLAFSYNLCKEGLREALPQKVELNGSNLGDWENLDGWFYDGNVTRTLNGKNYDSFSEYIADKMGEDGFNFIGKANGDQGSDSYYDDSVTRKLCVLKTQGLDCTDPKYKTFDDFAQDVQNAGYYCGLKNGTGYPKDHWDTFSNKFDAARKNLQQFNSYYQAVNQYDAAVQLILENVELKNVDPKTRTYVICRTESNGILQSSPGIVGLPNPGERTYHKTGVCESHVRVKAFAFRGHNTTVVRVPFSRVHGLWMIERGKVSLGKYHPEQHAQYLGANENETGADTHGLPIVYVGTDSPVSESHKALAQWERNNPNLVVTGIYSK